MFLTFEREVAVFWSGEWSGASFLFFANKWISAAQYVMDCVGYASLFAAHVSQMELVGLVISSDSR